MFDLKDPPEKLSIIIDLADGWEIRVSHRHGIEVSKLMPALRDYKKTGEGVRLRPGKHCTMDIDADAFTALVDGPVDVNEITPKKTKGWLRRLFS